MKPLFLSWQAFASYPEKESLDFTLLPPGLFLICGPTGAGKTTIFDALCFALYGVGSGSDRKPGDMRSDFADPELKTEVFLRFEHQGQIYEITRSPVYDRPLLRGKGTTRAPEEAVLRLPNGEEIHKLREVNEAISELLGLDVQQFRQTGMLAQGEFAKLLQADSAQRSEIFRQLFATEHIERLQNRLKEECSALKEEVANLEERLRLMVSRMNIEREDLLARKQEWLAEVSTESPLLWLEAQEIEDSAEAKELKREGERYDSYLQRLHSVQEEKERYEKNKAQAAALKRVWEEWIEKSESFEAREKLGEEAKRFVEKIQSAILRLQELQQEERRLMQKSQAVKAEAKKLEAEEIKIAEEKNQWETSLPFYNDWQKEATLLEKNAPKYERREEVRKQKEKLAQQVEENNVVLQKWTQKQQELEAKLLKAKELVEEKAEIQADLGNLRLDKEEANKQFEDLRKQEKALLTWQDLAGEILNDTDRLKEVFAERSANWDLLAKAEAALLRQDAARLALRLVEGEACPVCGSKEHPAPAQSKEEISAEELDALRESYKESEERYKRVDKAVEQKRAQLEAQWQLLELEDLKSQEYAQVELSNQLAWVKREVVIKLNSLIQSKNEKLDELAKLLTEMEERMEKCVEAEQQSKDLAQKGKAISDELSKVEEMLQKEANEITSLAAEEKILSEDLLYPSGAEAEKVLHALLEKMEAHQKKEKWIKAREEEIRTNQSELREALAEMSGKYEQLLQEKQSLSQKLDREQASLRPESLERFTRESWDQETLRDWNEKLSKDRDALLQSQSRYESFVEAMGEEKTFPEDKLLAAAITERKKKRDEITDRYAKIKGRLEELPAVKEEWQGVEAVYREKLAEFLERQELSEVANGQFRGGSKRDFESYLQGYWFEAVIRSANQRLEKMSEGRYLLEHLEDQGDRRKRSGLDLQILDRFTSQSRAISTLSGGEGFMAALSLALGLSDVASASLGGIALETLFIDEGFGSLDQHALEQAVRVLENVSEGTELCGIISHVAELKDMIPTQVVVEKSSRGSRLAALVIY